MKTCTKCGATDFYKSGRCKSCCRAYYAANKDRIAHKVAEYQAQNPDKRRAYAKTYRERHPDRVLDLARSYSELNAEAILERKRKWHQNNPYAVRVYSHSRRIRKLNSGVKLSKGLAEKLFGLQRGKCACCGRPLGTDYHMDHIMPLSMGGLNADDNIQLLRAKCNLQKSAKHPVDFMRQRGYLI